MRHQFRTLGFPGEMRSGMTRFFLPLHLSILVWELRTPLLPREIDFDFNSVFVVGISIDLVSLETFVHFWGEGDVRA